MRAFITVRRDRVRHRMCLDQEQNHIRSAGSQSCNQNPDSDRHSMFQKRHVADLHIVGGAQRNRPLYKAWRKEAETQMDFVKFIAKSASRKPRWSLSKDAEQPY